MSPPTPTDDKVDAAAAIPRRGEAADLAALVAGDPVQLTVDGRSRLAIELVATPAPVSIKSRVVRLDWIVP